MKILNLCEMNKMFYNQVLVELGSFKQTNVNKYNSQHKIFVQNIIILSKT